MQNTGVMLHCCGECLLKYEIALAKTARNLHFWGIL